MSMDGPGGVVLSPRGEQLYSKFEQRYGSAKYAAGLLIAFIDVLDGAKVPGAKYASLDELFQDYPPKQFDNRGRPLRSLVLTTADGEFAIRRAYEAVLRFFVFEKARVGYPSSAPDATGNWKAFIEWIEDLLALTVPERAIIRQKVVDHVLATIEEKTLRPEEKRTEPALFEETLRRFPLVPGPGEPSERSGAALQGIVFGFLRADNPHLQVRVDRVRAGGERIGKIGDVDGWDGVRLAISAEVKQYTFSDVASVSRFISAVAERGAVGIVAAVDFEDQARAELDGSGIVPLSVAEMLSIVKIWDLAKQRIAVSAFSYFIDAVENSPALYKRYQKFLAEVTEGFKHQIAGEAAEQEDEA